MRQGWPRGSPKGEARVVPVQEWADREAGKGSNKEESEN